MNVGVHIQVDVVFRKKYSVVNICYSWIPVMFCFADVFVNKLMFMENYSCFLPIIPYSYTDYMTVTLSYL